MATLNIGGKRVKVDDAFLSMTPEQQQQAVDEIAAQIGDGQQQSSDQTYQDLLSSASAASTQFAPPQQPGPDLMGSTAATLGGIVNGIPVIGPLAQKASDAMIAGGQSLVQGGDFGANMQALEARRAQLAEQNPIANIAGNIAGGAMTGGAISALPGGARALGLEGANLATRMGSAAASTQGLYTADQLARGQGGLEATGYGLPAALGAAGPVVAEGAQALGGKVADTITGMTQRGMTQQAVQGAPTGQALRSAASEMFEQSNAAGVMIDRPAFGRLWTNIGNAVKKMRPNAQLDPKAMGALQVFQQTLDDVMRPGSNTLPDLQDLHILRQAAQRAAISAEGRDAVISDRMIDQIDDFVRTLKPGDIAGGADPREAANALLNGISTWHRAGKVSLIEEAIRVGEAARSGPENGIRNAFASIIKNQKLFNQFSKAEQETIKDVANGTFFANAMRFAGKGGIGSGGNSWLGAMLTGSTASFSPLGPAGGIAAVAGASLARKGAEKATRSAAETAMRAAATPNIPVAPQMPNLLAPIAKPLQITVQGATPIAVRR